MVQGAPGNSGKLIILDEEPQVTCKIPPYKQARLTAAPSEACGTNQRSWLQDLESKESTSNAGVLGLIPGLERSPGEGNGYLFRYSCLENSMDRGAWWATVHGVTKSRTQLRDFHFTATLLLGFPGDASGKEPTYQCRRHKRLGFDPWVGKIPWRAGWQHIPVFLPGESHGLKRLSTHTPLY